MKVAADYYTPYIKAYEDKNYTSKVDEYFAGQDIGKLLYEDIVPKMKTARITAFDGVATEVLILLMNNIISDENLTAEQALSQGVEELQNRLPDEMVR